MKVLHAALIVTLALGVDGFSPPKNPIQQALQQAAKLMVVPVVTASLVLPAFADQGASSGANAKITTGGASTLQSGRTIGTL